MPRPVHESDEGLPLLELVRDVMPPGMAEEFEAQYVDPDLAQDPATGNLYCSRCGVQVDFWSQAAHYNYHMNISLAIWLLQGWALSHMEEHKPTRLSLSADAFARRSWPATVPITFDLYPDGMPFARLHCPGCDELQEPVYRDGFANATQNLRRQFWHHLVAKHDYPVPAADNRRLGADSLQPAQAHTCHARGCEVATDPKMFMCKRHWYMLPVKMRNAVWREYSKGQENRKDPTPEYLRVTREAINWLADAETSH